MAVWGSIKVSGGKQGVTAPAPALMRFSETLTAAMGNRKAKYKEVSKDLNLLINKDEECSLHATSAFNVDRLKSMMQKVIRQQFIVRNEDGELIKWVYNPEKNSEMCQKIAKTVKDRIRTCNYARYRIVSLCTIVEKDGQGVHYKMKYIMDPYLDNYIQYVHDMAKFWIISTVILVYKD